MVVDVRPTHPNQRRSSIETAWRITSTLGLSAVYGNVAGSQTQPTDDTVSQSPTKCTGKRRVSSWPGTGRAVMTFSKDQVSEVTVQANGIPAQYGRTTSAIINQATRSGANQFHGNASWSHLDPYEQTQALGAAFPPSTADRPPRI